VAIYRARPSRWPAIVAALIVGVVLGALVAYALLGGRPADLADAASQVRRELAGAAALLEVVEVEYSEAVSGGSVVRPVEYQGSLDALARSRARYEAVATAVAAIDASRDTTIRDGFAALEALMRQPAPPDAVRAALGDLAGSLRGEPTAQ
jgi:hypothetical protein